MCAIVETGGKQHKAAASERLKIEQIPVDVNAEITFDQVSAAGAGDQLKVGASLVSGAAIKTTVISHGRHDKVHIFRMRYHKHYQKHQGHRQNCTELRIDSIVA